jgi:replication factor C small subunit
MSFLEELIIDESPKKDQLHTIWVEKYRPQKLEEYIGNEALKTSIKKYIAENDLPHILLHSDSPGTGKTSAGKLIIRNISCDSLYINASDENSVDDIRTKVKGFASTLGFKKLKVVFLDEADYITTEGQAALRNLMETYSKNTRFILTCNYVEKISLPVRSRLQIFEVIPPSEREIAHHLVGILKKENVTYVNTDIAYLVKTYYPDIRKVIGTAQQSVRESILKIDQQGIISSDDKLKLVEILSGKLNKSEKFDAVRQLCADTQTRNFMPWYSHLYKNVDTYAKGKVGGVIAAIAEGELRDTQMPDKEINFVYTIQSILSVLD